MSDPWLKPCRFINKQGLLDCYIGGEPLELRTLASYIPEKVLGGGSNMYSSRGSTVVLTSSISRKEAGNSLRECRGAPSVGYAMLKVTRWSWGWLGSQDVKKTCIWDLPIE